MVTVALARCKSYCYVLLLQNGDVYTTAKLTCKQIARSGDELLDLYFCDLFRNRDIVDCCYLAATAELSVGYCQSGTCHNWFASASLANP